MNPIYAATAVAISAAVALAIVHPELPKPPAKVIEANVIQEETVAPKSDLEPIVHVVRTVPIPVEELQLPPNVQIAEAPPEPTPAPVKAAQEPKPKPTGDVCARHGGHRVDDVAHHGWHCVFPKRS